MFPKTLLLHSLDTRTVSSYKCFTFSGNYQEINATSEKLLLTFFTLSSFISQRIRHQGKKNFEQKKAPSGSAGCRVSQKPSVMLQTKCARKDFDINMLTDFKVCRGFWAFKDSFISHRSNK